MTLTESVNAELLSILAAARGCCDCGMGSRHDPDCLTNRATRMHSAMVPAKCARCIVVEPDPPLGVHRTRDGGWLCPSCSAQAARDEALGAWLRSFMTVAATGLTPTELVSFLKRHMALARS